MVLTPRVLLIALRFFDEKQVDPISILAGLVQTGLYLDFFYSALTSNVDLLGPPQRVDASLLLVLWPFPPTLFF